MEYVKKDFSNFTFLQKPIKINIGMNLDYSLEQIKYSNNNLPKLYRVSYRFDNENLIITNFDKEFLQSENLSGKDLKGSIINNHPNFKSLARELRYLSEYNDMHTLHFVREKHGILWNITLAVEYPIIEAEGRLMTSVCTEDSLGAISCSFAKHLPAYSIFSEKVADKYIIKSFSEEISKYINLKIGDDLGNIIRKNLTMLNSSLFITKCIEENKNCYFLDELKNNCNDVYFLCNIVPICHFTKTSVLLNVYRVSFEQYLDLHKKNAFFEHYFISLNVGVAFYQCDINSIISSDKIFDDFYRKNKRLLNLNESLRRCQREQNIVFKEISILENSSETSYEKKYSFAFVPLDIHSLTMIIISPTIIVNKELQSLYSNLSSREVDVVNLVLKGCKNSYIANTLGIAEGTVKKTLTNSFAKMGVSSRIELIKKIYNAH